jgi:hypothetical protein
MRNIPPTQKKPENTSNTTPPGFLQSYLANCATFMTFKGSLTVVTQPLYRFTQVPRSEIFKNKRMVGLSETNKIIINSGGYWQGLKMSLIKEVGFKYAPWGGKAILGMAPGMVNQYCPNLSARQNVLVSALLATGVESALTPIEGLTVGAATGQNNNFAMNIRNAPNFISMAGRAYSGVRETAALKFVQVATMYSIRPDIDEGIRNYYKMIGADLKEEKLPPAAKATKAITTGAVVTGVSYPIATLKTIFQSCAVQIEAAKAAGNKITRTDIINEIRVKHGWRGLFPGLGAGLLLSTVGWATNAAAMELMEEYGFAMKDPYAKPNGQPANNTASFFAPSPKGNKQDLVDTAHNSNKSNPT